MEYVSEAAEDGKQRMYEILKYFSIGNKCTVTNNCAKNIKNRLDWENSDKMDYKYQTGRKLSTLISLMKEPNVVSLSRCMPEIFSQTGINFIYNSIVSALDSSAQETINQRYNKNFKKYWWDVDLTHEKQNSMKHYKAWEMAGKPKYGEIAEAKVRAHNNYKKAIHKTKTESEKGISIKLQNKLLKANKKKFWRSWQSCFKNKIHNNNLTVGGLSDTIDIANYLASNFKQTCTPNSNYHQNKFKEINFKNKQTSQLL